ncbi:MAG: patatin-like phospholipase family protein [Acholeplasmataceae bacterium]|nr:patatin-like phospholipase family protein [Acholeplasmataceae bacterium]
MSEKIGLALGGGGARGSYQIGVLKAFRKHGLLNQITHVSGTSIGAINALMVMANFSHDRMIDIWEKIENKEIYGQGIDRFKIDRQGLFSLQEIYQKLKGEIPLSEIRSSKIKGFATAAKLKKGSLIDQVLLHRMEKEVFFLNEFKDPLKAILASASIPILFGSTEIDDAFYVDGGTIDNTPVQPLIDAGCQTILAVPIDGFFNPKKFQEETILLVNFRPHYIFRTVPIDVLDFDPADIHRKVTYGEMVGNFMIDKLKELNLLNPKSQFQSVDTFTHVKLTKEDEKMLKEAEENNGS